MLYMAASLDERTEQAAIRDLEELERVTRDNPKVNKHVNLLVQIDRRWPGYAERYCVEDGRSHLCKTLYGQRNIKDPDKSTGNPKVLREFVRWGRRWGRTKKGRSPRYLLVLWGHQYGLGFGRDHENPLTLPEIVEALGRQRVHILGANACAMSYVEAAYELRGVADFLVAPQIAMPLAGWPYDRVLGEIASKPDITPKEFAQKIVQQFMASFNVAIEPRNVSLTVLDLKGAERIAKPLKDLTKAVTAAINPSKARETLREHVADAFLDTAHGDERPLIDLVDLCDRLKAIDPQVLPVRERKAAAPIIEAAINLSGFLKPEPKKPEKPAKPGTLDGKFIVSAAASPELDGIHGVGIFAPSVTGAADLMRLRESEDLYKKLKLIGKTGWARLAYKDLKELLDPVNHIVAEFVGGMSATNREDRFGVAQLLVSIHRSFVRLEKALGDTEKEVVGGLNGNGSPIGRRLKKGNVAEAPTVFGWPFLHLVPVPGNSYSRRILDAGDASPIKGASSLKVPKRDPLLAFVRPFARLEEALANVERTVKKVTTHTRLGLGSEPPKTDLGAEPPKTDLGAEPPKTDLGAEPPKTDLGAEPPKTDLGLFPWLFDGDGGFPSTRQATGGVAASYAQVARSLQLVEGAVARAENDVRAAIKGEPNGATVVHYKRLTTAAMNQSFRDLHEVVSSAKRTIITVLVHSGNGLGPAPLHHELRISRQQLAIAGGLSSRELRLLAIPTSDS
jgi:hypothetical protein